ncbi:hypothetical protein BDP81DRAFT_432036 [Colletotrichum phormii]|uniref:Uncharacterized protein n=1 Tax=Colletotrichum phormii TaxID=359342 RepID=A0AAI9ZMM8_9PEZI|nr:uncharacterized protein BDP81DRAFT_432036 [Colletotrichum phormii]KAK1634812.1 hypothetical protein BDP81DRAFT_432036 [Colletotrichum phormii]
MARLLCLSGPTAATSAVIAISKPRRDSVSETKPTLTRTRILDADLMHVLKRFGLSSGSRK